MTALSALVVWVVYAVTPWVLAQGSPTSSTPSSTPPFAPSPPAELDPTTVTPGVLGFTVTLLLGIATFLLIRSMIKHLAKVPREPDTRIPPGPPRTPGSRDSRPPPSG